MQNHESSTLTDVNRKPQVVAGSTAIALSVMLVMLSVVADTWPWRIVFAAASILLAVKLVVALRSDRADVSDLEVTLRRVTSVDKIGSD